MCVVVKSLGWQNQTRFIWQKMSDALDSVTRWRCAEWWHYTAAARTTRYRGILVSSSFAWSEYGMAELCWAGLGCDVMYHACVKKYDRWHQYIITLHSARPPAPPPTPASSTVMRRPQIMRLRHLAWRQCCVNCCPRVGLACSASLCCRERPESHKSWLRWWAELVSNMW